MLKIKKRRQIGKKGFTPLEIRHRRCLFPFWRRTLTGPASLTGQASLELALSVICIFLLLLGALKIFVWVNSRLVTRQELYEESRISAGSDDPGKQIDDSDFPKLDIFKGE